MLPLRLRGTRGIRTRYVCSSCCAHVSGVTGSHGRGAATTQTYRTKKTKAAAPPPGGSPEDVKPSDAADNADNADNSKARQSTQADKSAPPKVRRIKVKEGEKPVPRRKKKASSSSKADTDKDETAPAGDQSNKPDETVKLWKETLDVLKNLRETQDAAEGALADQATSKGENSKNGGADTKRSLKSHFPPLQSTPSNKARERQAKLLEGTLDVLRSVLTAQAGQKNKASKTAKATETPGPTAKAERKQTDSKGAKEEDKRFPWKKSGTSEAAVALGVAALLNNTQPKKIAAVREGASKVNNMGRATLALESLKDFDDNNGEMGWGLTKKHRDVKKVKTQNSGLKPIHVDTAPVPRVEYGLDRVLFNEGVYVLQDPRTRVFNFDPYLATIMPVDEFDFEALKQYVTSSKDTTLIGVAKKHNKKFTGSTSSMTSTLAHFHYLLSSWRPINPERISKGYELDNKNFGAILRAPSATFLHYKDGTYAIDADKEYDSDTILSMLGKSMEKLLTAPKEEFEKYRRSNSHQLTEEERNADESYHYTTFGDFMMRSQLDAYDPRLPGTGVFDLKTRAVVSIRMDAQHHEKGVGYEIRQRQGQWESFEREYYDMIRLAFLKYSLQVRMGRMDGIFVAYHNTQRIFGFQYIPLEEMDLSLHGTTDLTLGNREFMASLQLWEEALKKATERFPEKSLRVHVETRPSKVVPFMYFFAEPVDDHEIKAIQEQNKEEAAKFQERVLGIKPKTDTAVEAARAELDDTEGVPAGGVDAAEDDTEPKEEAVEEAKEAEEDAQEIDEEDSEDVWEDMMDVVEQTMESDAQGISAIRDAIEDALEQSGLLHARSSEEAEQYVEALLKAIVDVDAEKAKTDEASGEQKQAQDVRPTEETDTVDQSVSSPPAPKPSPFSFLTSWFGSGNKEAEAEATAKQEPTSGAERDQNISASSEQDLALGHDAAESSAKESKAVDEKSDDSLKDLLIKLTTRIGSSSDAQKATEELSEDQAKLRNFESILLEMMPKTQEAPAEAVAEEDAAANSDADKEAPLDTPAPGIGGEPAAKPVLGMILTIRNKVNSKYVQRPEKLTASDNWNVEYTMEEVAEDKVQGLYEALKRRRHAAHYKDPGRDQFKTAFDGQLKYYSKAGEKFRKGETKLARKLPVYVVGQDHPVSLPSGITKPLVPGTKALWKRLAATTEIELKRSGGVFNKLKAEGKTPFSLGDKWTLPDETPLHAFEARKEKAGAEKGEQTRFSVTRRPFLAEAETATTKESLLEKEAVVEVAEQGSTSFQEWRERDQQKQDSDKEQDKDTEQEKKGS
ncbi:putative mitochondrial membrane protein pet127 [Diaporthe ampelina]|uniref:Putative mitochondrial membrane protein pet127 n=1 Tax=Diaporthe ampelina TaxID=1214573 RepID=A0A0G2HPG2_9PEZI|nr:putative mitochondrial membrane protein pet127 [Diaporthe ampelina]